MLTTVESLYIFHGPCEDIIVVVVLGDEEAVVSLEGDCREMACAIGVDGTYVLVGKCGEAEYVARSRVIRVGRYSFHEA